MQKLHTALTVENQDVRGPGRLPAVSDFHAAAREYAAQGLPVFPAWPGQREPATVNGFYDATTDLNKIDEWWTENPNYNVCIFPAGAGLVVIDRDEKNGKHGKAAFDRLCRELTGNPPPKTRTANTPTGGDHLYYLGHVEKDGPAGALTEGVDVKSCKGYVVAPPSVTADGAYTWEDNTAPLYLPWEITDALAAATARPAPKPTQSAGELFDESEPRDWLSYVDANAPRSAWVKIIAAIHATPVRDDGAGEKRRAIAHEWSEGKLDRHGAYESATPSRYEDDEAVDKTFDSLPPRDGGITYRTIIYFARLSGFKGSAAGAPEWVERMNAEYAVVRYGSQTRIANFQQDGEVDILSEQDFKLRVSNQFIPADQTKAEKPVAVGPAWLRHPARRQHTDPGVVFEPGAPERAGAINLWTGFAMTPKAGEWSLFRRHILENMCEGDRATFDWVVRWMAAGVQWLDRPLGSVIALHSARQGTGKGLIAREYGALFGRHFLHVSNERHLLGNFNAHLGKSVFAFFDEALWAGNRRTVGTLKALITEPTLAIEAKGRDVISVPNRLRIMIASNEKHIAPVEAGDRRFAVFNMSESRAQDRAYFDPIYCQMGAGGREAMLHDLLRIDLTDFNPQSIPNTSARAEQKLLSLRGVDRWLYSVLADGRFSAAVEWTPDGCTIDKDEAYREYLAASSRDRDFRPEGKEEWARGVLAILGAMCRPSRPRGGTGRRQVYQMGPLAECRAVFARHIGAADLVWPEI